MKKFKYLVLLVIPVFMLSCNTQSGRERSTAGDRDTVVVRDEAYRSGSMTATEDESTDFIEEAVSGSKMEIQLGRYAEENAQNPRVRNFGAMMARNHAKAHEELEAIAQRKNITIPDALQRDHNNELSDLQKKTGAEFDRDYMSKMVDAHEEDVDNFKKYAEEGDDPDLKTFAAKTLPMLLMHQDSARNIRDAVR